MPAAVIDWLYDERMPTKQGVDPEALLVVTTSDKPPRLLLRGIDENGGRTIPSLRIGARSSGLQGKTLREHVHASLKERLGGQAELVGLFARSEPQLLKLLVAVHLGSIKMRLDAGGNFHWGRLPGALDDLTATERAIVEPIIDFIDAGTAELHSRIDGARRKAASFLANNVIPGQTEDRVVIGWDEEVGARDEKVAAFSTAQGILAMRKSGLYFADLEACIETLVSLQDSTGGWAIRHWASDPTVQGTSYALLALGDFVKLKLVRDAVQRGKKWLRSAVLPSGAWGSTTKSSEARVFSTALAIRALRSLDPESELIPTAADWLIASQRGDGGWGCTDRNEEVSAAHTAHAVLALSELTAASYRKAVDRGLMWLASAQRIDDKGRYYWADTSEALRIDGSEVSFAHVSSPWVISAFLSNPAGGYEFKLLKGLRTLLDDMQQDGHWRTSLTQNKKMVWPVHDSMHALELAVSDPHAHFTSVAQVSVMKEEMNSAWSLVPATIVRSDKAHPTLYAWTVTAVAVLVGLIVAETIGEPVLGEFGPLPKVLLAVVCTIMVEGVLRVIELLLRRIASSFVPEGAVSTKKSRK